MRIKKSEMNRILCICIIVSTLWYTTHPIIGFAKSATGDVSALSNVSATGDVSGLGDVSALSAVSATGNISALSDVSTPSNASTPSDAAPSKTDRSPEPDVKSEIFFYYDPEPLAADVYVRAGLFDSAAYDYHEYRNLMPRDAGRQELKNVFIQWDIDEYDKNISAGKSEFQISGAFGPNTLKEDDYKLWEAGLLQVEASSQPHLNVHVRPADMVTTYVLPLSGEPSRTVRAGTAFKDAGLPDSRKLSPINSLYDKDVWFSIIWNEEQYSAGMAGGAGSFVVDGVYQIASFEDEDYKKMWEQGLIRPSQPPQITVNLYGKPETPIFYYNSYGDTGIYHTRVKPGTGFEQIIKPQEDWLSLRGGEWYDDTLFQIVWNEEEYQRGMAGGADSFEISGVYGSALLGEEEQEWWNEGLIQIEPGSSPSKLRIHVVKTNKIPFTISFRSGSPLFYFPTPQGAEQVIGEVSMDGKNWYSEESTNDYFNDFSENSEFWICQYDEEGELIDIPQDVPSYYRLRITGSAYEGVTDILTINNGVGTEPDDNGDIDGNRGGGGQRESERVNGPDQAEIDKATGPGMLPEEIIPSEGELASQEVSSENITAQESNLVSGKPKNQELKAQMNTNPTSIPNGQNNNPEGNLEQSNAEAAAKEAAAKEATAKERAARERAAGEAAAKEAAAKEIATQEIIDQEIAAASQNDSIHKRSTSAVLHVLTASVVFMGSIIVFGYFRSKKRR